MSRRLDIELTSQSSDGAFTWRAAGARQPRGTVVADLVPDGRGVGDVLRAEVESGLEGLEVVALATKVDKSDERPADRIEVLGAPRRGPDVSVSYAPGARRRRTAEGRGRRDGGGRERPGRREPGARGTGPRRDGEGAADRQSGGRPGGRPAGERSAGPGGRRERRAPVSTAHRNALLATLGPQELPVAEQLLRGGIPAVRQAIAEQNATGPAGGAAINADAVLSIAEQLLARVNLAGWKDRAAAAQAAGRDLRLRELRAVVTASRTVTLDEEGRALAKGLRDALDQRLTALREEWAARMAKALEDGRVTDALGAASRPPEPAARLPAELAVRLAEASGSAMTADVDPSAWLALLEMVVESPVRRSVKPVGIPDAPEAKEAALRAAGSVPELAKLLGLRVPPPPPPRRGSPRRPPVMAAGGGEPAGGH